MILTKMKTIAED
jgi:heat shock protein 5